MMTLTLACSHTKQYGLKKVVKSNQIMLHSTIKVMLYSYLILKKMNECITDSLYINKYTY